MMKTISAIDGENNFDQFIEAAQRQPVAVSMNGRASVAIMSAQDYERRRKRAWKNLLVTLDETGNYATSQGLTEQRLEQLLTDES